MRLTVAVAVASSTFLLSSIPADARPPAYAYKAGGQLNVMSADETVCHEDAMKAMNDPAYRAPWMPPPPSNYPAASAAGSSLAQGFAKGLEDGKRYKLTYYDCMIAKGYSFRRPDDAAWKQLKKLPKAERLPAMQTWMLALEPLHPEAPRDEFD